MNKKNINNFAKIFVIKFLDIIAKIKQKDLACVKY